MEYFYVKAKECPYHVMYLTKFGGGESEVLDEATSTSILKKVNIKLVMHTFNPSNKEREVGRSS